MVPAEAGTSAVSRCVLVPTARHARCRRKRRRNRRATTAGERSPESDPGWRAARGRRIKSAGDATGEKEVPMPTRRRHVRERRSRSLRPAKRLPAGRPGRGHGVSSRRPCRASRRTTPATAWSPGRPNRTTRRQSNRPGRGPSPPIAATARCPSRRPRRPPQTEIARSRQFQDPKPGRPNPIRRSTRSNLINRSGRRSPRQLRSYRNSPAGHTRESPVGGHSKATVENGTSFGGHRQNHDGA